MACLFRQVRNPVLSLPNVKMHAAFSSVSGGIFNREQTEQNPRDFVASCFAGKPDVGQMGILTYLANP